MDVIFFFYPICFLCATDFSCARERLRTRAIAHAPTLQGTLSITVFCVNERHDHRS